MLFYCMTKDMHFRTDHAFMARSLQFFVILCRKPFRILASSAYNTKLKTPTNTKSACRVFEDHALITTVAFAIDYSFPMTNNQNFFMICPAQSRY